MPRKNIREDIARALRTQFAKNQKAISLSLEWVGDSQCTDRLVKAIAEVTLDQINICFAFSEFEVRHSADVVCDHSIEDVLRNVVSAQSTLALVDPRNGDALVVNVDGVDPLIELMLSARGCWESVVKAVEQRVPGAMVSVNRWAPLDKER